jgi:hypothetical protein
VQARNLFIAVLLVVLAVALALPVGALRDDNMIVGRANGAKGYNTSLYSTSNTATLTLVNNRNAGSPALDLQVRAGPALAVNTSAWIQRLNADYVDGYTSHRLRHYGSDCTDEDATDGDITANYFCPSHSVDLPGGGTIHASGSVEIFGNTADPYTDNMECVLLIDFNNAGTWTAIEHSRRAVTVHGGDRVVCAAHAAFDVAPFQGNQTRLGLMLSAMGSQTDLGSASMHWHYLMP